MAKRDKRVPPVRPRRADAKQLELKIRARAVDPIYRSLRRRVAWSIIAAEAGVTPEMEAAMTASDIAALRRQWLGFMSGAADEPPSRPGGAAPKRPPPGGAARMTPRMAAAMAEESAAHMAGIADRHRARTVQTFWRALRVDVRPLLIEAPVRAWMRGAVHEATDLIVRMDDAGRARFREFLLQEVDSGRPFDRRKIMEELERRRGITRRHARLLARDQTTKATGKLTELRNRQIGLRRYEWSSSGDARVRPSHAALDGRVIPWDEPPAVGHPGQDIQCRCVALPVIDGPVEPSAAPAPA